MSNQTPAPFSRRAIEDAVEGQPENVRFAVYVLVEQVEISRRRIHDTGAQLRRVLDRVDDNIDLWFEGKPARINDLGELQGEAQRYDVEIAKFHTAMSALACLVPVEGRQS